MKKVILLAGYPATGKTYMSNMIKEKEEEAIYLSQDVIKEILYDMVGFDNAHKKEELIEFARSVFYNIVEKSVARNELLILDYPFSFKQMEFLTKLKHSYDANFLTIRLIGDLDVLYNRRIERDLASSRNKGHIMDSYHGNETYTRESYPLSREEYKLNCRNGKYDEFEFGSLLEEDVTDYEQIDYELINRKAEKFFKE